MAEVSVGFIEKTKDGAVTDRPIGAMSDNVFHTITNNSDNITKTLTLKSVIDNYLDMAENTLFIHRGSEVPAHPEHVGLWIETKPITDNDVQKRN